VIAMSQHPLPHDLHLETLAVRLAADRSQYGENSEALYLTSGYVQPSAEASARRFAGEEEGYTYGRSGNPTVSSFEMRLAALEGTEAALATSSGMSAVMLMLFSLLKAGDHVVYSQSMFGSTLKLIGSEFARFGVESTVVPQTDLAAWKAAIRPNTKILFAETPTNPLTEVCDIAALADLAHNAGALLAVDNCFATPILQRPMDMGADIVMHSGTKYLDGQRMGGAQRLGDAGHSHACSKRTRTCFGSVVGAASCGVTRVLPRFGQPSTTCLVDEANVGHGRRCVVV
jgi:O-succinylhomoserine sulfhydrylase